MVARVVLGELVSPCFSLPNQASGRWLYAPARVAAKPPYLTIVTLKEKINQKKHQTLALKFHQ